MGMMMSLLLTVVAAARAAEAPAPKAEIDARKIYAAKCGSCHGKDAKGNAAMAKMFKVKPETMDWTSEINQKLTDAELEKSITAGNGKMPAFKAQLKPAEIKAMVAHMRSLQPADEPVDKAAAAEPKTEKAPATAADADAGKKFFEARCITCHAKDAKGNPAMVKMFKVDKAAMDLTSEQNQKKTDAELTKLVTDGNGKMPAFKGKLKDGELADVVAYMRSLKAADKPAHNAAPPAETLKN